MSSALDLLRHLNDALADEPFPGLHPVFTWNITCDGADLGVGVSPTQVEAVGFMSEALLDAPPGAAGVVRPARLAYSGRDYLYDPPTVEGERVADGVLLRHPDLPGGRPRKPPRRRLSLLPGRGATA